MAFSAGVICCPFDACVMLDTDEESDVESWDTIPHVTEISFTETSNTSKVVTSSSGGRELSVCGTVTNTGVLGIACHDGVQPYFCINNIYRIMWSIDCDNLAVPSVPVDPYYKALIRITSKPNLIQISNNAAPILVYGWELVSLIHEPPCTGAESTT